MYSVSVEIVTEQMLQPQVVSIHYSRYRISFDILHELGLLHAGVSENVGFLVQMEIKG